MYAIRSYYGVGNQRLLQGEDALRSVKVVEAQAPVDDFQQAVGILAFPAHHGRGQGVLAQTFVGGLGRITSYNVCYTKLLRMNQRIFQKSLGRCASYNFV